MQLGRLMATSERRIRPEIGTAHQYVTYAQFMQAHRYRLEQMSLFERWDGYLTRLVEKEERAQDVNLNDPSTWDVFHNRVTLPIRCAFWFGWEEAVNLKRMYDKSMAVAARRRSEHHVLQVANGAADVPLSDVEDLRPVGHDPTGMITLAAEGILDGGDSQSGGQAFSGRPQGAAPAGAPNSTPNQPL